MVSKLLPPTAEQNLTMAFQQFYKRYCTSGRVEEYKIWETASMFSQKDIRNFMWKFVNRSYGVTNEYYKEKKGLRKMNTY